MEHMNISKYLSNLGHYRYVKVHKMRLLYCHGSDRQVSGFSADFTSVTSSKAPLSSFIKKISLSKSLATKSVPNLPPCQLSGTFYDVTIIREFPEVFSRISYRGVTFKLNCRWNTG